MNAALSPFTKRAGLLSNELEREFDGFLGQLFGGCPGGATSRSCHPKVNFAESEGSYQVSVELPGMDSSDIDIELKKGVLSVTGERKREAEDKGKNYHHVESSYGQFCRMIRFAVDVDSENVEAEYRDGVLRVSVPKAKSAQSQRIAIKT